MKLTIEPTSAIARTTPALRSLPIASSSAPKAIGSQIARLSRPIAVVCFLFLFASPRRSAQQPAEIGPQAPGHEAEDAEQHHQGVPVEAARLQLPEHAGGRAD